MMARAFRGVGRANNADNVGNANNANNVYGVGSSNTSEYNPELSEPCLRAEHQVLRVPTW